MYKVRRYFIVSILIVLIFVTTACQNVNGTNLNDLIQTNLDVSSYEGKSNVSIEYDINENYEPSTYEMADLRILELLDGVNITLSEIAFENETTFSVEGTVDFKKGSVEFSVFSNGNDLYFEIEGAKQPIVIENVFEYSDINQLLDLYYGMYEDEKENQITEEQIVELQKQTSFFMLNNFPNPENLKITPFVSENINGNSKLLTKIELTMDGSEFVGLINKFIRNIVKDDEGLSELLSQLYDVFAPLIIEELKNEDASYLDDYMKAYIHLLENKEDSIEFVKSLIKAGLIYLNNYAESAADDFPFDDSSYLSITLFIDGNRLVNKSSIELFIEPKLDYDDQLNSMKFNFTSERWNINSDTISAKPGFDVDEAISVDELSGRQILESEIHQDSILYDILKNDLRIAEKTASFYVDEDPEYYGGYGGYMKDDRVYIPLRASSVDLDFELEWDEEERAISFSNGIDKEIMIQDNIVTLKQNDEVSVIDVDVEIHHGITFIPAEFLAEFLDAELTIDTYRVQLSTY